jgi:hypothetical protein
MPASSWLIGEFTPSGTTLACDDGVNPIDVVIPQGARYIDDTTNSLSLIYQLAQEIDALLGAPGTTTIILQRDRHIRINTPGTPLAIDWTGNTDLRDALGFTINLAGAASHTAPNVSPFIWAPGLTEISSARLGRVGTPVYDTQSGGGGTFVKPVVTTSQYRVINDLEWRSVHNGVRVGGPAPRVWYQEIGGEHFAFWREVLHPGGQFAHYRGVDNDENSTAAVALANRVGPYVWRRPSGDVRYDYDRTIQHVEARCDVKLPVVQVSELSP